MRKGVAVAVEYIYIYMYISQIIIDPSFWRMSKSCAYIECQCIDNSLKLDTY